MKKFFTFLFWIPLVLGAQNTPKRTYWQQQVDYKMDIFMDVKNFEYHGEQILTYTNHSPDTLRKVYYHLYNNAFQPGSEMDARLQNIDDPDDRMVHVVKVGDKTEKVSRIKKLKPDHQEIIQLRRLSGNRLK